MDRRDAIDLVTLPFRKRSPQNSVLRRIGFALGLLFFIAIVVFLGRDGYRDSAGGTLGILDALYYASVTVTTTGYGDIAAVTDGTRLATLVLITPARILFLILVVGTTVEVLTERSRQLHLTRRWRRRVHDHYVICGFGSTGEAAAIALLARGVDQSDIVVVDSSAAAVSAATAAGFTAVHGNASRVAVLEQAGICDAASVIVTPNRDDTAVLVTLTARQMNSSGHIVVAVRENENLHLLSQSGADAVIDASASVGRLLGLATQTPAVLDVIDDLLDAATDLEFAEVMPVEGIDGILIPPADTAVVAILRGDQRLPVGHPAGRVLRLGDRLVVARSSGVPSTES